MTSEYTPEEIVIIKACECHGWSVQSPDEPKPLGRGWNPSYGGQPSTYCCNGCAVGKKETTDVENRKKDLQKAIEEFEKDPSYANKEVLEAAAEEVYAWSNNPFEDELYIRARDLIAEM